MAGHADKIILALLQFLAGRSIQRKGDHLARLLLEEDAAPEHGQATAILTHQLGFKRRVLPACGDLLDRALEERRLFWGSNLHPAQRFVAHILSAIAGHVKPGIIGFHHHFSFSMWWAVTSLLRGTRRSLWGIQRCKVVLQQAMNEDVAATYFTKQDVLSSVV
jgi:hypothetical protein